MRGASVFVRGGARFAAAPLEVPMTIGICRAQRSIADHAILGRRGRAGADRHCSQHNAQCDNHASHGGIIPSLGDDRFIPGRLIALYPRAPILRQTHPIPADVTYAYFTWQRYGAALNNGF